MKDILNYPNCAAPIQNDVCPYCGSVFLDWASFDLSKPSFVKIKDWSGHIKLMKLVPTSVYERIEPPPEQTYFYADNQRIKSISAQPDITIEAEFRAVPFHHTLTDKMVLSIDIDPEKANEDTKRAALLGMKED